MGRPFSLSGLAEGHVSILLRDRSSKSATTSFSSSCLKGGDT